MMSQVFATSSFDKIKNLLMTFPKHIRNFMKQKQKTKQKHQQAFTNNIS